MNKTQEAIKLLAEANGMTVDVDDTHHSRWHHRFDHNRGYAIIDENNTAFAYVEPKYKERADLIAAAPDLLEAAERLILNGEVGTCKLGDFEVLTWEIPVEDIRRLEHAAIKAEGQDNE